MPLFHAIILGIVEGLTEFIPVSSSGHLIVVHHFLGAGSTDLAFDAVIQMGTIFAVLIYFWKDLWKIFFDFLLILQRKPVQKKDAMMVWALIIGTIPAIVFGLLLQKYMETLFRNVHLVAYALIAGSALMYAANKFYTDKLSFNEVSVKSGLIIGFYQCLALIPGVSRSGATISGGLFQGFSREEATRFSFLLSFPIIVGAGSKELLGLHKIGLTISLSLVMGTIVAFCVGLWSIRFLMKYLKNHSLDVFVWYRVFLAVIILTFL